MRTSSSDTPVSGAGEVGRFDEELSFVGEAAGQQAVQISGSPEDEAPLSRYPGVPKVGSCCPDIRESRGRHPRGFSHLRLHDGELERIAVCCQRRFDAETSSRIFNLPQRTGARGAAHESVRGINRGRRNPRE